MRVLFWASNFWPVIGGAEVRASQLLLALQERGHEFLVITSSRPELPQEARFHEIPVHRLPFRDSYTTAEQVFVRCQQVARLREAFAPDLIHRNCLDASSFFLLRTAKAHPAPVLVTLCNTLRTYAQWP